MKSYQDQLADRQKKLEEKFDQDERDLALKILHPLSKTLLNVLKTQRDIIGNYNCLDRNYYQSTITELHLIIQFENLIKEANYLGVNATTLETAFLKLKAIYEDDNFNKNTNLDIYLQHNVIDLVWSFCYQMNPDAPANKLRKHKAASNDTQVSTSLCAYDSDVPDDILLYILDQLSVDEAIRFALVDKRAYGLVLYYLENPIHCLDILSSFTPCQSQKMIKHFFTPCKASHQFIKDKALAEGHTNPYYYALYALICDDINQLDLNKIKLCLNNKTFSLQYPLICKSLEVIEVYLRKSKERIVAHCNYMKLKNTQTRDKSLDNSLIVKARKKYQAIEERFKIELKYSIQSCQGKSYLNLSCAKLFYFNFYHLNLSGANLDNVKNCGKINFFTSNFDGASFENFDFSTSFCGATSFKNANISNSIFCFYNNKNKSISCFNSADMSRMFLKFWGAYEKKIQNNSKFFSIPGLTPVRSNLGDIKSFPFTKPVVILKSHLTISDILYHALYEDGERTKEVLIELEWIDKEGNLLSQNDPLIDAVLNQVVKKLAEEVKKGNAIDLNRNRNW